MAVHARKEIDLLDEVEQPGHVHRPEQSGRDGQDSRSVAAREELAEAQTEDEEYEKAGFEIVHSRRRAGGTQLAGEVEEGPERQQQPCENAPPLEARHVALLDQA